MGRFIAQTPTGELGVHSLTPEETRFSRQAVFPLVTRSERPARGVSGEKEKLSLGYLCVRVSVCERHQMTLFTSWVIIVGFTALPRPVCCMLRKEWFSFFSALFFLILSVHCCSLPRQSGRTIAVNSTAVLNYGFGSEN